MNAFQSIDTAQVGFVMRCVLTVIAELLHKQIVGQLFFFRELVALDFGLDMGQGILEPFEALCIAL